MNFAETASDVKFGSRDFSLLFWMLQPVPSTPSTYHHGDLRNALVLAASSLVHEAGSENFSLREVARRVGVSANAAYRHFAHKEELLAAVAADARARLGKHMLEAMRAVKKRNPQAQAKEELRATGRAYVQFALENPRLFAIAFAKAMPSEEAKQKIVHPTICTEQDADPYALLSRCLDAMVQSKALSPKRRVGAELKAWTVVHGYASLMLPDEKLASPKELEALLDFVIDGICGS